MSVGLASYNFKQHLASDIGIEQKYLPSVNVISQNYTTEIEQWTEQNQMLLNGDKTKVMIFNQTRNYHFSTRIHINEKLLEILNQTKLLGLIMSNDLSTKSNTSHLVTKGYQQMVIMHKLYEFSIPIHDMVQIYCLFVRSILEFNTTVWFASISEEEKSDLECVQKVACKLLLKQQYATYENALKILNI